MTCSVISERGALNYRKQCTIALEYSVSKSVDREFSKVVKDAFRGVTGKQAICHSISYYCMARGIVVPLNEYLGNGMSMDTCISKIQSLISCAFVNKTKNDKDFGFVCANRVVGEMKKAMENGDIEQISQNANIFLGYLNDALDNLSTRDSEWNIRVSSSFDPTSWVYVEADDEGDLYIATSEKSLDINDYDGASLYPATGFYLTDRTDGKRLTRLFDDTCGDGLFITACATENGKSYLESSSNCFSLPKEAEASKEKIYFSNECTGEWSAFN